MTVAVYALLIAVTQVMSRINTEGCLDDREDQALKKLPIYLTGSREAWTWLDLQSPTAVHWAKKTVNTSLNWQVNKDSVFHQRRFEKKGKEIISGADRNHK